MATLLNNRASTIIVYVAKGMDSDIFHELKTSNEYKALRGSEGEREREEDEKRETKNIHFFILMI